VANFESKLTIRSLKIAALYSLFGLLWVLFSDQLVLLFISDAVLWSKIQTLKGWLFIFMTAILLFFMVRRTLRAQSQRELAVSFSEKRFRDLVNTIPDLIWMKDVDGCFLSCNATFERYLGVKEKDIVGKTVYDIFDKEKADSFCVDDIAVVETGMPTSEEVKIKSAEHDDPVLLLRTKIPIYDSTGVINGVLGIGRDITAENQAQKQKEKLENQLYQAQKIESIGHLAGGVAHDFNNMLGVILGRTEIALRKEQRGVSVHADLEEIRKASNRSADLTRQLLTFARKQVVKPIVLDVNEAISGVLQLLRRLIGENIELIWEPQPDLWSVLIDPTQFDQILTNLCINARDAIHKRGSIIITAENIFVDSDSQKRQPCECQVGEYVRVTVSDDGCGIDAQLSDHIFEPFYTTKKSTLGTGLGLSTVHGAVNQSGGFVTFKSELGRRTEFHIWLPQSKSAKSAASLGITEKVQRGHETILLVEDDVMLLDITKTMLQENGYQVLATERTDTALELARNFTGEIHLLLSDLVMPNMNGRELSERIKELRPDIEILFMSGYAADIVSNQDLTQKGFNFLQKPISFDVLSLKVHEILQRTTE
jgi:PAS domain S-box-containing protein